MSGARQVEIAVVGAGPAGLAAALAARRLGAEVILLDEYAALGGQYHKQPRFALNEADWARESDQARRGRTLAREVAAAGIESWTGATVWGLFPGLTLGIDRDGAAVELKAERLIIASGAHDRTLAFPGWTLPGVITPGAAQTLVKSHGVLPGRRVVVGGSGPFLLVVAAELAKAGAAVTLVEAQPWRWSGLSEFLRFPERWRELAGYLAILRRHGARIRLGRAVIEAVGGERVESAIVAKLGADGHPLAGSEERLPCDTLAVAFGFRASSELTRLAGCAHEYREAEGGEVVVVDRATGRSSTEAIYAAGEITGVAGSQVARAEGEIAGLSAARALGHWSDAAGERLIRAQQDRRRFQAFADLVNGLFAPPPALTEMMTPTTVACRCEGVTRATIERAVAAGAGTLAAVRMWTRCGMGQCQGRICGWSAARVIARKRGVVLADVAASTARIPIKPVPLDRVLALRQNTAPRPNPA